MKLRFLLRPSLAIVFGFIGALIAKVLTPAEIWVVSGFWFLVVGAGAFGLLGFILPELATLAGKAGIAVLAGQIVAQIPQVLPFRPRRKRSAAHKYINPMFVDTSALIDGRLGQVAQTDFLFGTLLVIPSVIGELHVLADSKDDGKRARGRRGLDVLGEIGEGRKIKVEVLKAEPTEKTVDAKLLKIAKNWRGKIITCDFNLNKVAKIHKVPVLNINELASAARTPVLVGESMLLRLVAAGKQKNQGVGYLADGTMVVVAEGAHLVGQTVKVRVVKVLQTAAGKMVFASL